MSGLSALERCGLEQADLNFKAAIRVCLATRPFQRSSCGVTS